VKAKNKDILYLVSEKDGKRTFINLVKDGKSYRPSLEVDKEYQINFTSYQVSEDKKAVTLFNVSGI
jgi:hypothetical protein